MPTFGRSMREHWLLDPDVTYLNHGTVGAPPRRVLQKQQALRDEMERQPSRFVLRELNGEQPMPWRLESRYREAIAQIAPFLGARADDLVFVPNVTTGLNAVLRSVPLGPPDEVLISDLAYGAIALAAQVVTRDRGATLRTVEMPFPLRDSGDVVDAFVRALTSRTKLVVVDHITAQTALVLPVAAIAAECRARGVPVLVDGAHAPGSIAVDIAAIGADWYAANLHKWCFAPRSCGILWAAPERQAALHPGVISWGITNDDWLQEFEWTGTRDPSPWLAAPAGLDFMRDVLGVEAMREWNHDLAWRSALRLGERWGRPWTMPEAMVGCMVTVPLPSRLGAGDADRAQKLRDALLFEHRIEAPVIARGGELWARLSMQVYNDDDDVERFAVAVESIAAT